ncbi:MAG: hypothetical protein K9K75_05025 [Deltaproteobacteria bacterium]|nr:hypothetical protein [Deltaproteobacteria bacterium]
MEARLAMLQARGVKIVSPPHTFIDDDVVLEQISGGAVLHPFTRLHGAKTAILQGAHIGEEAPTVVVDSCIGKGARVKGGFCSNSLVLDGATVGSGAHIRECCLLEEESSIAHSVGLKQTILFPFVALGSLVNFCDCLMAGGTSRANHSEVGSSYIHFNFTPHQDKATASLFGDVPRGVFLRSDPIFLGGQGGMVGPSQVEYGVVIAAGTVWRGEAMEPQKLLSKPNPDIAQAFRRGDYKNIRTVFHHNLRYIANLVALREWYRRVRRLFWENRRDAFSLLAEDILTKAIAERVARLRGFARIAKEALGNPSPQEENAVSSLRNIVKIEKVCDTLSNIEIALDANGERFVAMLAKQVFAEDDYIPIIKGLDTEMVNLGTSWLDRIVKTVFADFASTVPLR